MEATSSRAWPTASRQIRAKVGDRLSVGDRVIAPRHLSNVEQLAESQPIDGPLSFLSGQ
jgi:hypothetical protein